MTDTPLEGNPEAQGGTAAKPSPSSADSQPLSGDLASVIANLQRKIDAQDGEIRALKGGKDKAVDRVVKSNEEMLAKFAKYLNVDEEQLKKAQRESLLDDLVAERNGKPQPEAPIPGRVDAQGKATELGYIDAALELPANDSRVTELKLRHGNDPVAYLREGMKLKASFQTQPASPAEQLPPQGAPPPTQKGVEQLKQDYIKEMRAARGKPQELRTIKDKYVKAGVNIYEVDFT